MVLFVGALEMRVHRMSMEFCLNNKNKALLTFAVFFMGEYFLLQLEWKR